jgi:hypothetical protein
LVKQYNINYGTIRRYHTYCSMSNRVSLFQQLLDESSSDDDDEINFVGNQILHRFSRPARKHGGSVPGHLVKYRDREGGHLKMYQDYLAEDSTFSPVDFRRRFVYSCLLVYFMI